MGKEENVLENLFKGMIKPDTKVILGISGGADSVYLLHQCILLEDKYHLSIIVAHVNHGLRGKESDGDAKFVKNLAKSHKLRYEQQTLQLKKIKGNMEAMGREKRYEFFEKLRKKYKADWVLTGHHLNDNIETSLFNMIRGSSMDGLKGMQIVSQNRHLLRPLLTLPKTKILFWLKNNKIPHREDKTNEDTTFSRNFLRKKVIPLLKKMNPNFEETFALNLENFTSIAKFLEVKSKTWLTEENKIPLHKFLKQPSFLQKNILAQLYKKVYGSTTKLNHHQIDAILQVINLKKAGIKKEFGPHYFIAISRKNGQSLHFLELQRKKTIKTLKKA